VVINSLGIEVVNFDVDEDLIYVTEKPKMDNDDEEV